MKNRKYPIILGHKFRKGVLALKNYRETNGITFLFVRLKKEYQTGERFHLGDVESVETELVFTDRESLEVTVNVMEEVLKKWGKTDS